VRYFLWLFSMSWSLAAYAWPVTLVLLAPLGFAIHDLLRYHRESRWTIPWVGLAPGVIVPLLLLLYGTIWSAQGTNWTPRTGAEWSLWITLTLLVVQLVLLFRLTRRAGNGAPLVRAIGYLQFWWTLGVAFVAGMSITGDWL
jgi:hypothetical protein